MNNIKVAGYRILLEPDVIEDTLTHGSLTLVKHEITKESDLRNTNKAKVLQVGPDAYKSGEVQAPWCKEGDTVLINPQSGYQYHVSNDKCLLIVNEEDILAVIGG